VEVTLEDLDRWDPASVRAVAEAATQRAADHRATGHDIDGIVKRLEFDGHAADDAQVRAQEISRELLVHADECDTAARTVQAAASEIESIKSEWGRLQRMADHWGIAVDTSDGSLSWYEPDDPSARAEMKRRAGIVQSELDDLLRRADATDARLARSLEAAITDSAAAMNDEVPAVSADRRLAQIEAFDAVFGRVPVSESDWLTAAALDPNSYDPKNNGIDANIVVGRIEPVPGQGVVRTNLFIPSEDVWAPAPGWPPYDNNVGDNRGFSPTAGPEDSRVTVYTDFDNGIVVARQNPSVNADTGEVRTGTPSISALQQSNGAVLIRYNAADPFSPGGEGLAKSSGISVNGTIGIAPTGDGIRIGGTDITTFPALEIYGDRAGVTTPLLQSWPSFRDDAAGPLAGLPFTKSVGDPTVITSFNSLVPQPPSADIPSISEPSAVPITPQLTIIPPANLTPLGSPDAPPTVRTFTPLHGYETSPTP
jgi:hypothetical protein